MSASKADAEHQQALDYLLANLRLDDHDKPGAGGAGETLNTEQIAADLKWDHEKTVGSMRHLAGREVIALVIEERVEWIPTDEAHLYIESGTPEARLARHVVANQPIALPDLKSQCKEAFGFTEQTTDVGVGHAMKNKWILRNEDKALISKLSTIDDTVQSQLKIVARNKDSVKISASLAETGCKPSDALQTLKKRKLVEQRNVKFFNVSPGPNFGKSVKKQITDITQQMLLDGSWHDQEIKPYNFVAAGRALNRGSVHPLIRVMKKFRRILFSMGFEEMPTTKWVESSFWNFDTLFVPQQHPARDSHDTFYLKDPEFTKMDQLSEEYRSKVKQFHEVGGEASIGYRYNWSEKESSRNVLRTHTTAVSAQMLYQLAQDYRKTGIFTPKRYFSIDRVFRNETLDATHLAEFHQVEGLVAGYNLGLADLMGVLRTFYRRIGITDLKFKPAYNPYTEPSLEIFGYHAALKTWMEVGNSGVFRPEMLLPMGLPADVTVIAWGLSLERPTMIRYKVNNIRELFGHKALLSV